MIQAPLTPWPGVLLGVCEGTGGSSTARWTLGVLVDALARPMKEGSASRRLRSWWEETPRLRPGLSHVARRNPGIVRQSSQSNLPGTFGLAVCGVSAPTITDPPQVQHTSGPPWRRIRRCPADRLQVSGGSQWLFRGTLSRPWLAERTVGEKDCIMISGAVCTNLFALFAIFAVYLVCTVYPIPRHFPNGYQHSSQPFSPSFRSPEMTTMLLLESFLS
jgi:hypothetical protein